MYQTERPVTVDHCVVVASLEICVYIKASGLHLAKSRCTLIVYIQPMEDLCIFFCIGQILRIKIRTLRNCAKVHLPVRDQRSPHLRAVFLRGQACCKIHVLIPGDVDRVIQSLCIKQILIVKQHPAGALVRQSVESAVLIGNALQRSVFDLGKIDTGFLCIRCKVYQRIIFHILVGLSRRSGPDHVCHFRTACGHNFDLVVIITLRNRMTDYFDLILRCIECRDLVACGALHIGRVVEVNFSLVTVCQSCRCSKPCQHRSCHCCCHQNTDCLLVHNDPPF